MKRGKMFHTVWLGKWICWQSERPYTLGTKFMFKPKQKVYLYVIENGPQTKKKKKKWRTHVQFMYTKPYILTFSFINFKLLNYLSLLIWSRFNFNGVTLFYYIIDVYNSENVWFLGWWIILDGFGFFFLSCGRCECVEIIKLPDMNSIFTSSIIWYWKLYEIFCCILWMVR